jgi:hypothetical protein
MNSQPTLSEILDGASRLGAEDFEKLYKKIAILHVQRSGISPMPQEEVELLEQINKGFPSTKLERLRFLDWKLETSDLNEKEALESLRLATAFENYTVRRLQLLIQLADLRKVSVDALMTQLELTPLDHA